MMPTIRAIVFDAFGTLLTYNGQRRNPYRLLRAEVRLPFLTRNASIDTFAAELGIEYHLCEIRQVLAEDLAGIVLFDDVDDTLSKLRTAGLRLAVCSNLAQFYGAVVRQLLPGLDGYIFSYEVGAKKPEPAIYEAACTAVGCTPREALFIGDSRRADFNGPRAYGMHAELVDRAAGQNLSDALGAVLPKKK